MVKREGKTEFQIVVRASSLPSFSPEHGATGTISARGYPGHQKRVSIKAPRRRESGLVPGRTNQRAMLFADRGGPRSQSGWS